MKHKGCILEFTKERNAALMRAYRCALSESDRISVGDIAVRVVGTPCHRYWVSEERAAAVCSDIFKGRAALGRMRPAKCEMFMHIYQCVQELRAGGNRTPLRTLVSRVVHSPAPGFFMSPRSAMEIIYKIKNGRYGTGMCRS